LSFYRTREQAHSIGGDVTVAVNTGGEQDARREGGVRQAVYGSAAPPGKDRWHHLQYIPVQFPDGVEFIRDPFDAEIRRAVAQAIGEIFGRSLGRTKRPTC
jgi:hypothetical protein